MKNRLKWAVGASYIYEKISFIHGTDVFMYFIWFHSKWWLKMKLFLRIRDSKSHDTVTFIFTINSSLKLLPFLQMINNTHMNYHALNKLKFNF